MRDVVAPRGALDEVADRYDTAGQHPEQAASYGPATTEADAGTDTEEPPPGAEASEDAIRGLLDTLLHSGSRSERRRIFDRLVAIGEPASGPIVERLRNRELPWYAQRNLLALLAMLGTRPRSLSLGPFIDHYHAAVRREAYRFLLDWPGRREWAVCQLLSEDDPRSIALGLAAARDALSSEALPILIGLIEDTRLSDQLRAQAVHMLEETDDPTARDALARLVVAEQDRGRLDEAGWIPRLAEPSRPVLRALETLKRRWVRHEKVQRVLGVARRSADPTVRAVARGRSVLSPGGSSRASLDDCFYDPIG